MAIPDFLAEDIFQPGGKLRVELFTEPSIKALQEAIRFAQETRWDSVRSPHIFMGLLSEPDSSVNNWGQRLGADLAHLLCQFRELFHQDEGEDDAILRLNREFLSDNVIRLIRDAQQRALAQHHTHITSMDLLISLLTASNSIVAECFERIGVTAAKLTELAVMAEQHCQQH